MAAVAKMLGMLMVMFFPGGLVLLCAYFLGRALHQTWLRERTASGSADWRRVLASVRLRDVLRDARGSF